MTEPPRNRKCKSCIFRSSASNEICCGYIFKVGHRRPCPPGEKCTAYIKGSKIQDLPDET